MTRTQQISWFLWIMFCTACSTYVGYAGCAHAQEESQIVPNVSCPSTALCVKDEKGMWIPVWYARDLLGVKEDLKGKIKELEAAKDEITSLRIADAEYTQAVKSYEEALATEKKIREMDDARVKDAEDKSTRRLRWGVGTSVVSVIVIGVLSAVLGSK